MMGATEVMGVTEAAGGKKREKKCRGVMVYAGRASRQVGGRAVPSGCACMRVRDRCECLDKRT